MVIQHRRHNQRPVENAGHEDSVLELHELVAEAAVGGVPEEPVRGAFWGIGEEEEGSGAEGEEVEEEEEEGGDEGDVEEWGSFGGRVLSGVM